MGVSVPCPAVGGSLVDLTEGACPAVSGTAVFSPAWPVTGPTAACQSRVNDSVPVPFHPQNSRSHTVAEPSEPLKMHAALTCPSEGGHQRCPSLHGPLCA